LHVCRRALILIHDSTVNRSGVGGLCRQGGA
jgi:hypothetical protein